MKNEPNKPNKIKLAQLRVNKVKVLVDKYKNLLNQSWDIYSESVKDLTKAQDILDQTIKEAHISFACLYDVCELCDSMICEHECHKMRGEK